MTLPAPHRPLEGYPPIADHGVIGNLRTVALVGVDGTIDWYCPERFDSPSVFGSILDRRRGGFYRIAPCRDDVSSKQLYLPDTNILITRFLSPDGVVEVQDFMPVGANHQPLVRRVVGVRGEVPVRIEIEPRFDYGRVVHERRTHPNGVSFHTDDLDLSLASDLTLTPTPTGGVVAEVLARERTAHALVLHHGSLPELLSEEQTEALGDETIAYWRRWLHQSSYVGRWREMVNRSALTLKLLTYAPTGAMVAAPTTSLPEQVGGTRNWDYRFSWTRDFAFSIYALTRLGFADEAQALTWFGRSAAGEACRRPGANGPLRILYGIDPTSITDEHVLDHWEGYRGSAPVRIGNAAEHQLQLDISGEFLDALSLSEQTGSDRLLSYDLWQEVSGIIGWLCDHWDEPDEGIWEVRSGRKRFTFSRLMSWVALDRAIRIADHRAFPADLSRWRTERDALYAWIMQRGWNHQRQAFVQSEDADELDASLLLMPLVHFVGPTDPRWLSTLDAIGNELLSDSLVFRYEHRRASDGLNGNEGTFSMCTFWYVECLARARRLDEARLVFEKMLTYSNHLGLYSEQIGATGELLGNFPQAFTHLALISAAINLDRKLSAKTLQGPHT